MTDNMLQGQLKGVKPDPPAGNQGDPDPNLEPISPEPDADPKPKGEGDGKDKDRPDENWGREMARKQDKWMEEQSGRMDSFMDRVATVLENTTPVKPAETNGDPLASKSISELKALRPNVPAEQKDAFDEYIMERTVDEKVDARTSKFEESYSQASARSEAASVAVNRYPDLADPKSEFAKATNAKLKKLGRTYVDGNPRAVLDAANDVHAELGTSFRPADGGTGHRKPPGTPANKSNAAPANKGKKSKVDRAELERIGKRLSGSLPPGKEFDIDKIEADTEAYTENIDSFVRS